ncbi:hypothetical protein [Candidatus Amarolinea dominans]|uniref:hypothetical protein n=1 Tax=Candidatus Amarolinea dominans TaxID=3140696 RepID=UPI001DFD76E5|nr:hypothetical protein [Anaerolineae bacterium]
MENICNTLTQTLGCEMLWSAISAISSCLGAIFTGVAVFAIWLASKQLRFDAWLKAQDVFTEEKFTETRRKVFARLDNLEKPWTEEEKLEAKQVCRRMDEFAHLARFVGRKSLLEVWDDPLAKSWLVLEPIVKEEQKQTGWPNKWKAFQELGQEAVRNFIVKDGKLEEIRKYGIGRPTRRSRADNGL